MVFTFHKFKHYLLENKFVLYVNYMVLLYLVNKPIHVPGHIARCLFLFLKYEFIVLYKLGYTHAMAHTLFKLPNTTKLIGVFNQITNVIMFQL